MTRTSHNDCYEIVPTDFALGRLSPNIIPTAGAAATEVTILGNNLTGTTEVSFNGIPTAFTVEFPTYIRAFSHWREPREGHRNHPERNAVKQQEFLGVALTRPRNSTRTSAVSGSNSPVAPRSLAARDNDA